MRYVQRLISQVRKQTENEDVTDFTGIQDSEFLQYLNDAQHNLQALITQKHPNVFVREKIYDISANQDTYEVPSDCYLGNKILNVEFSSTGEDRDYYPLAQDSIKNRNTSYAASPYKYIRLDGNIILNPKPQSSGKLKVTYIYRVDNLNLRVGTVKTTTSSVTSAAWGLKLSTVDISYLEDYEYLCIVDKKGKSILKNLEFNSNIQQITITDPNTGGATETYFEITLNQADYVAEIPSGSYLIAGENSNSHSEFDDSVERYLIAYCAWKILKRDSSLDSGEAIQELNRMAREIVDSYALISDDLQLIPQLNDFDDWSY
jgi:hypothetical protein